MVKVVVKDLIPDYSTNEQGKIIYEHVAHLLKDGIDVNLSFTGVSSVSSSFLNTSLIELLVQFGYDYVKKHLKISDVNKHVGGLISRRIQIERDAIHS